MASNHESFWQHDRFAVVGHKSTKGFPLLTYRGLKNLGKTAIPVDYSADTLDGDKVYSDLESIPGGIEAVVIEVPKEESAHWVEKAADLGVKDVWIHMTRETPEAIKMAEERGVNLRTGTCAVMYVTPGLTYHSIHRGIQKLMGKY